MILESTSQTRHKKTEWVIFTQNRSTHKCKQRKKNGMSDVFDGCKQHTKRNSKQGIVYITW